MKPWRTENDKNIIPVRKLEDKVCYRDKEKIRETKLYAGTEKEKATTREKVEYVKPKIETERK
jgi:hypothetical protein